MQLLRNDDPRDNLERATRYELVAFAKQHGVKEITEAMPKIVICKRLRAIGLVNIQVPQRPLGLYGNANETIIDSENPTENAIDAADDLERQYEESKKKPSKMNELRAECKRKGIKMQRTDNLTTLREKLNGKDAS